MSRRYLISCRADSWLVVQVDGCTSFTIFRAVISRHLDVKSLINLNIVLVGAVSTRASCKAGAILFNSPAQ